MNNHAISFSTFLPSPSNTLPIPSHEDSTHSQKQQHRCYHQADCFHPHRYHYSCFVDHQPFLQLLKTTRQNSLLTELGGGVRHQAFDSDSSTTVLLTNPPATSPTSPAIETAPSNRPRSMYPPLPSTPMAQSTRSTARTVPRSWTP